MIAYCNDCDKYVCRNNKYPCDYMNVPEMIYDEFNICGYCQIKKKMTEEHRTIFEDKENELEYKIRTLNNDLLQLHKQLENITQVFVLTSIKQNSIYNYKHQNRIIS